MIYYFSGTGNSEFTAKRIAELTGDECISIYEAIKNGTPANAADVQTLVFVTPTHAWRIPRMVQEWIKSGSFAGNARAYFVMTCGSDNGSAEKYVRELCSEKGFELMGCAHVVMPENYVAMFPVPDDDEAKSIVRKALPVIDGYAALIMEGKALPTKRTGVIDSIKSGVINDLFYKFAVKADSFRTTESCIGCGKCAEECLTHNITLTDGKPVWGDSCIHCMKCICDCPAAAIEYGTASVGKPRYHCKGT